jgi:putative FmdB family regulatory protein
MPTYVYECAACGEFEQEQSIAAPPLEQCPQCGAAVHRLIAGGTGFIIKGGASASRCERPTPCCGRETRCDKPPCGE